MLLTVIIVNYNVKYYLFQCLESLRRSCKGLEWEVYVVDNNSSDHSVEFLSELYDLDSFPELHIIANKDNPGFGKANNQAYRCSKGEFVLFLNPDTFLAEHTIKDCVTFMRGHLDVGCLGVKMLNANGSFAMESRRGVPTPWASFCKITKISNIFPKSKRFGRYYMQHLPIDSTAEIEIVSGAFMMVRRKTTDVVGVFDEDYFMHCEDIDLSYRMLKAGYNNYYIPTVILHYKGESTKRYTISFVNTFYKAILVFFHKHFNHHYCLLKIIIYVALYLLGALSFIRGQYNKIKYLIKNAIKPEVPKFICFVNGKNKNIVETMSKSKGFNYVISDNILVSKEEFISLLRHNKPDYALFDTSLYDYKTILELMQDLPNKERVSVATLYPREKLLLTYKYIYSM